MAEDRQQHVLRLRFLLDVTKLLQPVASKVYWTDLHPGVVKAEIKDLTELRDALGGLTVEEIEKRFFRMAAPCQPLLLSKPSFVIGLNQHWQHPFEVRVNPFGAGGTTA